MVLVLACLALALKEGLSLRRNRKRGQARSARERRLHTAIAKFAVVCLLIGAAGGPLSAVWLRGWDAFATAHAWVALAVCGICIAAATLGLRLERGAVLDPELHGWLGLATILLSAAAFGTGFVLLP